MTESTKIIYDVTVIGGGPSGMMAAIMASETGANVLLLEKNNVLGKKLLISGGGRCNVTNNKPVVREMLSMYKAEGKFLFSTFMQHGVKETLDWFTVRDVETVEENEGRLFPSTKMAETVQQALVQALADSTVTVVSQQMVTGIMKNDDGFEVVLKDVDPIQTKTCVVATGGTTRPETGSTGEGFRWLGALGHTIIENSFALVPLTLSSKWTKELSGLTITDCKLTLTADGAKHSTQAGKILFTHVGVTGPTILNMSKTVGDLLEYADVIIKLDMFPGKDPAAIDQILRDAFTTDINKKVRNALGQLIPAALAKAVLHECGIDDETKCHSVTRTERIKLGQYLKGIPLPVSGLLGRDKAVVSAGGVALNEVDFKTMESKILPGLFLVGDILNINRPSGGYSLQLCWTTGAVAGEWAGKSVSLAPGR
ncbi:MAG: putative Rossmann fold flavoprotein [Candidatus Paceibacteria bacterium]|jgi:predicted Rossmann fold flavoprotein